MSLSRYELLALGALAAALAALTALVAAGTLTGVDQFAVDHLMPWLEPSTQARNPTAGYWQPFPSSVSGGGKLLDLFTYPCSLLVSGAVVVGACAGLRRRGLRLAALVPAAAWAVGNAAEWIGKHALTRPALYATAHGVRIHVVGFDDSFPSGHMIRGIVVAYAIALLRPRLRPLLSGWAVLIAPALVLQGAHTPTDVLAGAAIGAMLVLLMRAVVRSELEPPQTARLPRRR